jgi:hypothetical protein
MDMKITKCALIAAIIMASLSSALFGLGIVLTEQRICEHLLPMQEGAEKIQPAQGTVGALQKQEQIELADHFIEEAHKKMYVDLAFTAWFLILTGLLIFVIRRLPISN